MVTGMYITLIKKKTIKSYPLPKQKKTDAKTYQMKLSSLSPRLTIQNNAHIVYS